MENTSGQDRQEIQPTGSSDPEGVKPSTSVPYNATAAGSLVAMGIAYLFGSFLKIQGAGASIVWVLLSFVSVIVAFVLSIVSLAQIKRSGEGGRWMAILALVLASLSILAFFLALLLGTVVGAALISSMH